MDYKHEWDALKAYLRGMIVYYRNICEPASCRALQRVMEQMTYAEEWYKGEDICEKTDL